MASKRSKKKTSGKTGVRFGTQSDQPRPIQIHVTPPRRAERQHARPGAGIKRARAVMLKKSRSS
jgi:hypothetical protein